MIENGQTHEGQPQRSSDSPRDTLRKAATVAMLAEAFGRPTTDAMLEAYRIGLSDLPADIVEKAASVAVRERKYMPTASEIRELAGCVRREDRPLLAWMAVERAIGAVGSYKSPDFDDRIINAAIRSIGGWVRLCGLGGNELDVWARREFLAAYGALQRSVPSDDALAPLAGLGSSQVVVRTGLPWVGEVVRRIERRPEPRRDGPRIEFRKP